MRRSSVTAPRLLAVIAAICIVGAIAIATVMPSMLSLGQFVALADHAGLTSTQDYLHAHLTEWIWVHIAQPVLQRPAWLIPVCLGIIAAGLAVTLNSRQGGAPHSRRKRS